MSGVSRVHNSISLSLAMAPLIHPGRIKPQNSTIGVEPPGVNSRSPASCLFLPTALYL